MSFNVNDVPITFIYTFTPAFLEWFRSAYPRVHDLIREKDIRHAVCQVTMQSDGSMGYYAIKLPECRYFECKELMATGDSEGDSEGDSITPVFHQHPEIMARGKSSKASPEPKVSHPFTVGYSKIAAETLRFRDIVYTCEGPIGPSPFHFLTRGEHVLILQRVDSSMVIMRHIDNVALGDRTGLWIKDDEVKYPRTYAELRAAMGSLGKQTIIRLAMRIPKPMERHAPFPISINLIPVREQATINGFIPIWDAASFGFEVAR
jgi:hypothetical protein